MLSEAIGFLVRTWKAQVTDQTQFFFLCTKSKGGRWKDHSFKWPVTRLQLRGFFDKYPTDDYNLYFCPHGFTHPERKQEFAEGTAFLWADLDEASPSKCEPRPQVAWESSPGRYAALWRLNRKYPKSQAEGVNKALSYSNGADRGGWDFSQVLRIPGTRNHKYPGSPRGKMMWDRDNAFPLSDFPDEEGVDDLPTDKAKRLNPQKLMTDRRMKADTRRTLAAQSVRAGHRSDTLWKLGNELVEQGFSTNEVFALLKASAWNKFKGRNDEDKQLKRELVKLKEKHAYDDASQTLKRSVSLIRMSDVKAESVDWLWWPYIPIGKLTFIEGDPGLGKSWLTMAIATYISARRKLPGQDTGVSGTVLIMSAEDGLGDTIRPRLDTLKAVIDNIYAIEDPVRLDEDGVADIDHHLADIKPKLVIIDPIVAYMGGNVDLHKANETREVMARLARLAEKHHCAIIAVRHLTKGGRDKAIYRGIGSIDLTAAARSVILVGRHPDNPDEGRVLCHIKCNLAPLGRAQAYLLSAKNNTPFKFEGPVDFTAEDVFKAEATGGNTGGDDEWATVCEWLRELLEEKETESDLVRHEGEARGYSKKLINRARKDLNIRSTVHPKTGKVMWSLGSI